MTWIVGLCGAHGTGKSVIVEGLRKLGHRVDDTSLSRQAQRDLGWSSLSVAQESEDNMWALQDAVLRAMTERDMITHPADQLTVVVRTPADTWAYMMMWVKRMTTSVDPDRVNEFRQKCVQLSTVAYKQFWFVPVIPEIPFVAEPGRADEESRADAGECMETFLRTNALPYRTINAISREGRIAQCETMLQTLKGATGSLQPIWL